MKKSFLSLVPLCAIIVALSACVPDPPKPPIETTQAPVERTQAAVETTPARGETTVGINGGQWTCEQITSSGTYQCSPLTQQAFDVYKEKIDTYVRSGDLGAFNDGNKFRYEDAAFVGLVACAIMIDKGDSNAYINAMLAEEPFKTVLTDRDAYIPAWVAAKKHLCTDLEDGPQPTSTGHKSQGDFVIK
jgi:hypothetical protein